jgi:hypothetical protein
MAGVYHCSNFRLQIADCRLHLIQPLQFHRLQSEIDSPKSEIFMTPSDFRKIALSLPETEERQHMDHPDFRVAGKIFATLGYPDTTHGMVKLLPEEQHYFSKDYPGTFVPVKGAWGKRGATTVDLKAAKKEVLIQAIQAAWRNTAPKRLLKSG